jgi:hypothetical protein
VRLSRTRLDISHNLGLTRLAGFLSLAMGLTTILTTIWFCPPETPKCKSHLAKAGHLGTFFDARPISGRKSHKFFILLAATSMILLSLMIFSCP